LRIASDIFCTQSIAGSAITGAHNRVENRIPPDSLASNLRRAEIHWIVKLLLRIEADNPGLRDQPLHGI